MVYFLLKNIVPYKDITFQKIWRTTNKIYETFMNKLQWTHFINGLESILWIYFNGKMLYSVNMI